MFVDFNILNQLGSPSINSNTFANRPAAGQTGRLFVSTDTFEIYRDNGTTWDLIGGPGSSTITGTGTATQVAYFTSSQAIGSSANLFWDNTSGFLGVGTAAPTTRIEAVKTDGIGIYANFTTNAGSGSSTTALWAKNVTNSSGFAAVIEETTPNTTAGQYPLLIKHSLSSGTAGVGMGTGIHWQLPDDAGTFKTTQLTIETINAAAATYATRYRFNVQNNGSSLPVAYINSTGLGIFTATPGAALDIHSTGIMAQLNSTSATGNSLLAFQRSGSGLWRIGDQYNAGNNFFELHNTVLGINAMQVFAATNKTSWQATENYTSGVARGNYFDYNLTLNPANPLASPNAISAVGASLDLTLEGSITIPSGARSGLDAYNSIRFTTTGTLTHNQGTQIRAYSNLTAGWAFNGSATGTITHLAGLRALFPDNTGSAIAITNNYALLLNDQTANTGTVTYTNRWGVYQEGASDLNYFAGNSLFGTTTNVGAKIAMNGYIFISNRPLAQIVFNSTGTYYGQIQNDAADKWSFARNAVNDGTLGTPIMTWQATNIRVGINTDSPNSIFEVKNTGTGTKSIAAAFRDSSADGNGLEIYNENGLSSIYSTYYTGAGSNQDLGFYTTTSAGAQNQVMRLTSTQRVGIGTGAPQLLLELNSSSTAALPATSGSTQSTGGRLRLTTTGASTAVIDYGTAGGSGGWVQATNKSDLSTNYAYSINPNGGNVLVGTTTDAGQKLQVNGSAYIVNGITISTTSTTPGQNNTTTGASFNNGRFFLNNSGSDNIIGRNDDGILISFRNAGNEVGTISITTTATAYNTSSDYRLKQNFKDFNALKLVNSMNVYDFEWKENNKRNYGVIAHELQNIIDYAVTGEKDGKKMQQVDYSKLVPILIKAIQELNNKINNKNGIFNSTSPNLD
jgi:hypothetical protein